MQPRLHATWSTFPHSKTPEHDIRRSYVLLVYPFILLEFGKRRARSPEVSSDSSDGGQLAEMPDGLPDTRPRFILSYRLPITSILAGRRSECHTVKTVSGAPELRGKRNVHPRISVSKKAGRGKIG